MANFTQSLSDTLYTYGLQKSTKFGTAVFGTDKYGDGANNGVFGATIDFANNKSESITLTDVESINISVAPNNDSLSLSMQSNDEHMNDGSGKWTYILPGGVTNDEQAQITGYTKQTSAVTTYTTSTGASTSWT